MGPTAEVLGQLVWGALSVCSHAPRDADCCWSGLHTWRHKAEETTEAFQQ